MINHSCTILGINGYLGRHLALQLLESGYSVFGYDVHDKLYSSLPEKISYSRIDITQKQDCERIQTNVDIVLFFAGLTGTKAGFDLYEKYMSINEIGLLNILDLISKSETKPRIAFPSTRLVYKGVDKELCESDDLYPKTIYAKNKIAGEQLLELYSNYFDLQYVIYRICVPYGNRFDDSFSYGTIGHFYNLANNKKDIVLFGDGSIKRTFTHVDYLTSQILETMSTEASINQIYNIDGETYSLKEVAELFAIKFKVELKFTSWPADDLKIESGHTYFNGEKIKKIIMHKSSSSLLKWIKNL